MNLYEANEEPYDISRTFVFFSHPFASLILGVLAIGAIVVASVIYQPAAAKTGYLLIWLNHKVYVMDIDTQEIYPVAPASNVEAITPSPGCLGRVKAPCWVVIEDKLYQVNAPGEAATSYGLLQNGEQWLNSAVSWSPDGLHVAYTVANTFTQNSLRLYTPSTNTYKTWGFDSDPTISPAWSGGCAAELGTACEIGYKTVVTTTGISPTLVAYNMATHHRRQWEISPEPIAELRWSPDNQLFYSRPSRHFYNAETHEAAYQLPKGATLANVSPDLAEMVYYQTFTLSNCQTEKCLYLGVWLTKYGQAQRELLYDADLVTPTAGLNYIPTWRGRDILFFQEGNLVYYDQEKNEAAIWMKSLHGKLRSMPIFAPHGGAVAFIDNQDVRQSQYRLMIIDPKLQPLEKIIVAASGFQILAWLPN